MKFFIVDASKRTVKPFDSPQLVEAYPIVGLRLGEVDHGPIASDDELLLCIVVDEFSLYEKPERQNFFSIGHTLYAGNAVLYAARRADGETVNLGSPPPIMFYRSHQEVEKAIARGVIKRPEIRVNDALLWQWPQSRKI